MSSAATSASGRARGSGAGWRKRLDRFGDRGMFAVCLAAALLGAVAIVAIAWQLVHGAQPSISKFGIGFVTATEWNPAEQFNEFGAGTLLYGTVLSSFFALFLGAPISISIGLYLALMAPEAVRGVVGPLVELLAAVPSVIYGFWGILVLAPFVKSTIEPALPNVLGFIPLFGKPERPGSRLFTAALILTMMIGPIISSVSRDLCTAVPRDVQDGAAALGATRWEVVRGAVP